MKKLLYILLAIFLLLLGRCCGHHEGLNVNKIIKVDDKYEQVHIRELRAGIAYVAGKMRDEGWTFYKHDTLDCDDYAFKMFVELKMYFALRKPLDDNTSVAIGVLGYTRDNGGGHAINFADVKKDGKIVRVYFEPQPQPDGNIAFVRLTKTEHKNIIRIIY